MHLHNIQACELLKHQENQSDETKPQKIRVNCLSSDYDGTISPIDASRIESRVPLQTRVMLRQISGLLPISIITMKDLPFIMPRTPFAQAWSAIGGLETRIGKRVLRRENVEDRLADLSLAINFAKSHLTSDGAEIEDKQDSEGHTLAFCVDWRHAKDPENARHDAERIATYCKTLNLRVIRYEKQPFFDVYPFDPDKGLALREMLNELVIKNGVLYLGDSQTDNSAFRASSVGVGVIHNESSSRALDCDYLVKFEHVPDFLNALLMNDLLFSSEFPMIKVNPSRRRK